MSIEDLPDEAQADVRRVLRAALQRKRAEHRVHGDAFEWLVDPEHPDERRCSVCGLRRVPAS